MALNRRIHFHIRWSGASEIDYDAFDSADKAELAAKELVRHNETYSIEEYDDSCKRCAALLAKTWARSRRKLSPRK
jgi:hypothetical protein